MKNIHAFVLIILSLSTVRAFSSGRENNKKPLVIGHRGACGYLPEHSFEAKVAAFMMEADFLEQDVILTKDNVPIVMHDLEFDQVTDVARKFPGRNRSDSRYYAIDFTFDEIKQLDSTERFPWNNQSYQNYPLRFPKWQAAFKINSLEEEIQLIQGLEKSFRNIYGLDKSGLLTSNKKRSPGIYVEIKDPEFHRDENKANFSEIVLAILAKYNYKTKSDNLFLQCFDPIELRRIHDELKSELKLIQLLEANQASDGVEWTSKEGLAEIAKFADGIGPEKDMLLKIDANNNVEKSEFYTEAKRLGLFVHPYTFRIDRLPRYASDYNKLMKIFIDDLQVDGLFTDFPDLTIEYLKSNAASFFKHFSGVIFFAVLFLYYLIHE